MADEYVVLSVEEYTEEVSAPCWLIMMQKPDGTNHGYLFPQDTFEWRAAEYGTNDFEVLLDIVLHEPFLPPTTARRAMETGRDVDTTKPLYLSESTQEARYNHLARVERAKAEMVRVVSPESTGKVAGKGMALASTDPLDVLRFNSRIEPERLAAKREAVDINRWLTLYGELPERPIPDSNQGTPGFITVGSRF